MDLRTHVPFPNVPQAPPQGRLSYTTAFAILAATPGLYESFLENYGWPVPSQLSWAEYTGSIKDIQPVDVAKHAASSGILVSEMDDTFLWAKTFLYNMASRSTSKSIGDKYRELRKSTLRSGPEPPANSGSGEPALWPPS